MAEKNPWGTRSAEEEADDLFFEEESDKERKDKKEEAQKELKNLGMLLVSGSGWKEQLKDTLIEACSDKENIRAALAVDDSILEKVEKVSKATCYVRRGMDSESRLKYYEQIKDEKRLNKAKEGRFGGGTGFLINPKGSSGWFVITNNHVIMDKEEADSAEVIFDHLNDESLPDETKRFKVKGLVSKDIRTEHVADYKHLDFSVLVLESKGNFLANYACYFDERDINETILRMSGLHSVPIITFSQPHGLGKRISIGKYPKESKELPKSHLRHGLPTARGSSGANLIYFQLKRGKPEFDVSDAAFLHYRHGIAVSWKAIGPVIRKDLSEPTGTCK